MKNYQWHWKALLLAFCVSTTPILAQTPSEKQAISNKYDQTKLTQLRKSFNDKAAARKEQALVIAVREGWDILRKNSNGSFDELIAVSQNGQPIYYTIYNVNAAKSTRADHLNIGGTTGFNLDGQNMTAHVWDGGPVRITHQEFDGAGGNNRVTINDGVTALNGNSFHSQHVTGTIVASGFQAAAKGMAPQANALTHDWDNDLAEATTEASNGMLLSNHSYGFRANLIPDWYFGAYIDESRDWDNLMYNSPFYLMVVAAGNDGNDNSSNASPLNGNSSYDKLSGHSTSKNNMVVANGQDANVNTDGSLSSVTINSGSSEGPTDDLRVKPDITGNGTSLYSTYDNADNAYNSISGTSMASPNVTGTLLLLQQHHNNLNGSFMRSATLKGLALHTADDAGISGPDAIYGWGLLNGKAAAEAISADGGASEIQELTLSSGQTFTLNVDSDGSSPLLASISWTDPAGTANTGTTNLTTPVLVNDLDIRVTQGGTTFSPYRLTGVNSNNTGDNNVDPYERINVTSASGSYTIAVTHKGSLSSGSQNFSLIVTGLGAAQACNATTPTGLAASNVTNTTASLNWNAVSGATYDVRFREVGTTTWTTGAITGTSTSLTGLSSGVQYEAQVRSVCPDNSTSAYSASTNFTTGSSNCSGGIASFPYSESFENTLGAWTQSSSDDIDWIVDASGTPSSGTGPSSAFDGTYYIYMEVSGNGTGFPTKRAILTSPCFDLTSESDAAITFNYHMTGNAVGTITLEASSDNGASWSSVWSLSGDQGALWNSANVALGTYAGGTMLLRFNGVSGTSWQGDIAIDNLELTGGSTADTQAPTTPSNLAASSVAETTLTLSWTASTDNVGVTGYDVYQGASNLGTVTGTSANITGLTAGTAYAFSVIAKDAAGNESASSNVVNVTTQSSGISCSSTSTLPYSEGFESGFGAWTNASGDDFDWTRQSGGTPSSNTGPSSATEGSFYIYVESSTPNYSNKVSIIESPCYDLSAETTANFSFEYHMYGAAAMGGLVLEASTDGTSWTSVWSQNGNQGNSWQTANVNLDSYAGGTIKLRYVGTTGTTWQGDMAVDNIAMTAGGSTTTDVTLTLNFDDYPEETSWQILDGAAVVASGGTYGSQADGSTLVLNVALSTGCYDFVISDVFSDGICCTYGSGSYSLTDGATTLASGGSFGSSETTNFCVGGATTSNYQVATTSVGQPTSFEIYPNPVAGRELTIATNRSDVAYQITNLMGQVVSTGELDNSKVDVSQLSSGVYMIQLSSGGKTLIKKFVKQ
ncbi:MAG: S8 family serine peptidase [Cytophagales bacterium]|nr:S8 family serine peptidase [Cytophagales bacterium]